MNMHTFMKSIGFSKKESQAELEALIKDTVINADKKIIVKKPNGCSFIEYRKEFGENIGIAVRGEDDENHVFHIGHYFPYLKSTTDSMLENELFIHKKVDSDAYTGMCDDNRIGVSLIFYIQNAAEYLNLKEEDQKVLSRNIKLASLCKSGKIILPTQKRVYSHIASKIDNVVKNQLMDYARNGDMEAINYLTSSDMDKNVSLSERIKHEDLFSIVETSFIPYGSESDLYSILGNIVAAKQHLNKVTGESIWTIRLVCNDIEFETVVNSEDLIGYPMPGMRFKGVVWMQGEVDFRTEKT